MLSWVEHGKIFYNYLFMYLKPAGIVTNSVEPDQMWQTVASDLGVCGVWSGCTLFAQVCLSEYLGEIQ